jgi:NAD(P)-dependent dehydrogenase (short-subunit alcohol dehydrogenase family)
LDRLAGKTALVTGSGSGIGRAVAIRFAREGANVVIAEIDFALGEATAEAIRSSGGAVSLEQTDVTDEASVSAAVTRGAQRFGRLDVVVNCAGGSVAADGPVTEVDLSVYDRTLSLDLKGTILVCRHAIPHLIAAGGGAIVNFSSLVALRGSSVHIYSSAKGAVISLTRAIAGTYGRQHIRANAICPGVILTDRIKARFGDEGAKAILDADHPFGLGEPEDIANVALFLASDESRMVTGAVIPAEGGYSAY